MRRRLARLLFRIARWLDPSIGEVVEVRVDCPNPLTHYAASSLDRGDRDRFTRQVAKRFARRGPPEAP